MRKNKLLLLLALLMTAATGAWAQTEITTIPNGDFETWTYDGEDMPNYWNSNATSDGSLAAMSGGKQLKRSTDVRPGSSGQYSCSIWSKSTMGVINIGILTSGRIHFGSMSSTNNANYIYSDRDGSNTKNNFTNPCAMPFTGKPTAIKVWVKYVQGGTGYGNYATAKFSATIHGDADYVAYNLAEHDNDDNKALVVASAEQEIAYNNGEWEQITIPFNYTDNDVAPAYILINAYTNAYPGKGKANDYLYIDDIELEYAPEPGIASTYTVTMKDGVKDADKWTVKVGEGEAQALPIGGLKGDGSETVTLQYTGRLKVKGVKATSEAAAAPTGNIVDLATLTADYEAQDGETLTGTLAGNYKISIADGATVTLDGVTINGVNDGSYEWAGITCDGDATIILSGTNTVKGFYEDYPGIQAAADKTLIINGTGSLTASSYSYAAAIGGGHGVACGNIEIQGGTITATSGGLGAGIGGGYNTSCGNITISGGTVNAEGGNNCAGIGGGYNASWGNITISGGTVNATGGEYGAGIGGGKRATAIFSCGNIIISGGTVTATGGDNAAGIGGGRGNNNKNFSSCGDITITTGVTKVTATMGEGSTNSIGAGKYGNCGTVTIGGVEGAITTSPYTYDPTAQAKEPATVTTAPTGAAVVGVGKTTALVSGGVAEGGTMMYKVTTENTKPASTDGFSDAVPTAQGITASGKVYVWYYVKGDDTHSDSEIAATAIEVPVADIVWDATNVSDLYVSGTGEYEKEGVKLSGNAGMTDASWHDNENPTKAGIGFQMNVSGGFTFTAPDGKAFTKIEMKANGPGGWSNANLGEGWAFNNPTVTWTGSAASTVGLLTGANKFKNGTYISYIAFSLVDAE